MAQDMTPAALVASLTWPWGTGIDERIARITINDPVTNKRVIQIDLDGDALARFLSGAVSDSKPSPAMLLSAESLAAILAGSETS